MTNYEVVLSRNELILLCAAFRRRGVFGLKESAPLSLDQMNQAANGLRARGLAGYSARGAPVVKEDLLQTVGICALARKTVILNEQNGAQHAFHMLSTECVERRENEAGELLLKRLRAQPEGIDGIAARVLESAGVANNGMRGEVEDTVLTGAYEAVRANDSAGAIERLKAAGVGKELAESLVACWAKPHKLTAVHVMNTNDAGETTLRALTVTAGTEQAWMLLEQGRNEHGIRWQIRSADKGEITRLLTQMIT